MSVLILILTTSATAQTVTLPTSMYRPGRYVPLRIETDHAAQVFVRGDGVQGIDWAAPGRSSVTVPLLIYAPVERLTLIVNGKSVEHDIHALTDNESDPPELIDFWKTVDPRPPAGPAIDDEAYQTVALWQPGDNAATRHWTLTALVITVLVLGVAVHADPKRRTLGLMVAGVGLCIGISLLYPTDEPRRTLPAEGRPGWQWTWSAGRRARLDAEPWTPGLRFVPRSMEQLKQADAALCCDARGLPQMMRAAAKPGERVVYLRPVLPVQISSATTTSPGSER